ncbi:uncharacterized protein CELE_F49F1.12 [Caenorhabditis elegans]|uniref:Uncharacterized protein n=1 Tax=Caenorhabditis elegans TaxID=6239 RepID=Q9GZD7_CAEEL|nr:Uncharacterized protein CELE_F49F1.12 [Caenorhabditis elegans]CCD66754.1 Uncharacterized protein CELE_F49F1.12 [Caenorhabditis elegans]|eukprot:NP_500493.2 Uncharacterized protein CELE_F49F1.12 [Caenorhabditis elegans]
MAECIDSLFIYNIFIMTTSGILVMCFCKKTPPMSQCPVRPMTMSMREAQVSDVMADSTRTAMDNQKKSKKKKSKEPAKKKKKSADSSQKVSKKKKKSSKSKKSAEKKKPEVVAAMDPDVKSTQRSAERSEQPDQTAQTKTAKSGKDVAPAAAQTPAQDQGPLRSQPVGLPMAPGIKSMTAF